MSRAARAPTLLNAWLTDVSPGEVNAARSLVRELHSQLPDYRVVVSSTTDTGMAAARALRRFLATNPTVSST